MDAPISASQGAMRSLPGKLESLLSEPSMYGLHNGEKSKIRLLKGELQDLIDKYLMEPSEVESPALTAICWAKEVREMSYDINDFIDELIDAAAGAKTGIGGVKKTPRFKISRFREKLNISQGIAGEISGFRARVKEAIHRHKSYLSNCKWRPRSSPVDERAPRPLYGDAGRLRLVGMDKSSVGELYGWLTNDGQAERKVVSIVGAAGVGKTALANELYRKLGGQFQCRAFVRTSPRPGMKRILSSMFSQVRRHQPPKAWEMNNLVVEINAYLKEKTYFIIIDDLCTSSTWDIINRALPKNDCCSRILTTTEVEVVAQTCSADNSNHMPSEKEDNSKYIFKKEPLSEDESRELFCSIAFGHESECPEHLEEVQNEIIKRIVGLPLAIVTTASVLACHPVSTEQWNYIMNSLSSNLITNANPERIKEVLNLGYNNLPHHLKACMLYLSLYEEDYIIWKDDLVNQWIAEGFICAMEGNAREELARSYFDELVNRGLIQPVDINSNDEVLSCTVHHMVHHLIRYKSIEENFMTAIDHTQTAVQLADKVRRLSLHFSNAEHATRPASLRLSQVRSLSIFGLSKCIPSIVEFKLLQVLILQLWVEHGDVSYNLTEISGMFRLRCLHINACHLHVTLPMQMQQLKVLETLKIEAKLTAVPSDIVDLEHLSYLSLPSEADLPTAIGRMTSLRTLGYFDLGSRSGDNVKDLGKLTDLQDLHLTCSTVQPADNLEYKMKCLGSILGKLSSLKCLTLVPAAGSSHVNTLQGDAGASSMSISSDALSMVSCLPSILRRLEVSWRCCIFSSLPKWIGELGNLFILKIAVRELTREDIDILKGLPALTALTVYIQTAPAKKIIIDEEGFPVLTYFKFMCTAPCLSFMRQGVMPNVRKLKLGFNANRMKPHSLVVAGFKCLTGLREIFLKLGGAGADDRRAAESALQAAIGLYPNTLISRVQCVDVIFDGDEDTRQRQEQLTLGMQQESEDIKMDHPSEGVNKKIDSGISTKSKSSSNLQNPVAEHKNVEDAMVSVSTGAMNSILSKLATMLSKRRYPKIRGKREEIMSLKDELDAMNALLDQLADMPGLSMEVKGLRNQMREMTYAVEDCIDDLMLKFDEDSDEATRYPEKWDMLDEFVCQIRDLRGRVGKADLPSMVHMTEVQTLRSSYKATGPELHTLYNKATGPVGIDGPRDKLVKRMNGGQQQLQVACILGSGLLGKTTLATEVYNHIRGSFDCGVFIQVPRNIDITRLHKVILRQLLVESSYYREMDSLVEEVRSYLRDKRYLIIVDGVWSAQTWEVLKSALPENKRGSRILMTTDDRDIAISCQENSSGFIYCMEPLNARDSLSLFRGILLGSQRGCPMDRGGDRAGLDLGLAQINHYSLFFSNFRKRFIWAHRLGPGANSQVAGDLSLPLPMELQKVAKKILPACGGIPMAIIIVASILSSKPIEAAEWKMVEKQMEPVAGDGDVSKEMIRKMFHISYSHLPHDIKCCLLYLSVFPEKHFIRKDRLIWRWIAEGFLPKTSERSSWETGERYFHELIARNLIEPVYEEDKDDYEVPVGCKVHGLILEFITSLSNEENLVTTIREATRMQHDVIRRLSASYMNQEEDHVTRLISTECLSKVRSITILGRDQRVDAPSLAMGATVDDDQLVTSPLLQWGSLLLCLRFLRVLDLEDAKSLQDHHLKGTIRGLVLLRYLGLAGTSISQLPEEIGKVEQLETLDLRRNHSLRTLPASIASLQKLVRLVVDPEVQLPSEMSKMQELEQVSTISSSSLNSVAELLVKSKTLRMLDVNFHTETCSRESIMSFLRVMGNSNLESLSLCCGSQDDVDLLGMLLNVWQVPSRHLRRFKLKFSLSGIIPPRMASLVNVTHLDIEIDKLEAGGIRVLGDLPNLVLLNLTTRKSDERVTIREKAFQRLKVFTLWCLGGMGCFGGMGLQFTPGAMPQLRRLRLHFSARETLSRYGGFDFGIQHLSCLAQLHATINCYNATVSEVKGAEAAIRRQVSNFPIKPTIEFSKGMRA